MNIVGERIAVGKVVLAIAVVTLFMSSAGMAQNTVISWSALDIGFALSTAPTTSVSSVAGQVFVGSGRSGAELVASGFLAGLGFDSTGSGSQTGIIVYSRSGSSGPSIWMRATDGSFDTMVIAGAWPRLSHNGRYMIFHEGTASPTTLGMFLYDFQTGRDTLLYSNNDYLVSYDWFADDYHIVFDYSCNMMMMNRDGTGIAQLYQVDCYDDAPVARPGSWGIAHHNTFQGILVTDSLGVNRHHVPNTGGGDYWSIWSPDGQWIAFWRTVNDTTRNYYKIHPDGTGLTALTLFSTAQAVFSNGGAWTPDGRCLLVAGNINGVNGIYSIATDGSGNISRIPTTPGDQIEFVGTVTGDVPTPTGVSEREGQLLPTQFKMEQNYPNPFNPTTTINYQLPAASHVALKIYDILGREVTTLLDRTEGPGYKSVVWNSQNVASGMYFCRIVASSGRTTFTDVKKMIVMK